MDQVRGVAMGVSGQGRERISVGVGVVVALVVAGTVLVPALSSGSERPHYGTGIGAPAVVGSAPYVPPGRPVGPSPQESTRVGNRTRITPTTTYPASAVGWIQARIRGTTYRCTGTLIGPRTVLTAAHCIFQDGHLSGRATFYPARDGGLEPFGSCPATGFYILPAYANSEADAEDMGALRLGAPCANIGNTTGWFGYVGGVDWTDDDIWIWGYPGEIGAGDQMWESRGTVAATNGRYLRHTAYTTGGQSGAAVYCYYDPVGPGTPLGYYVTGVHVSAGLVRAYASRITRARTGTLGDWRSR